MAGVDILVRQVWQGRQSEVQQGWIQEEQGKECGMAGVDRSEARLGRVICSKGGLEWIVSGRVRRSRDMAKEGGSKRDRSGRVEEWGKRRRRQG